MAISLDYRGFCPTCGINHRISGVDHERIKVIEGERTINTGSFLLRGHAVVWVIKCLNKICYSTHEFIYSFDPIEEVAPPPRRNILV